MTSGTGPERDQRQSPARTGALFARLAVCFMTRGDLHDRRWGSSLSRGVWMKVAPRGRLSGGAPRPPESYHRLFRGLDCPI
jgi:hypothetical protein